MKQKREEPNTTENSEALSPLCDELHSELGTLLQRRALNWLFRLTARSTSSDFAPSLRQGTLDCFLTHPTSRCIRQ
jgi:hypothetical protein